MNRPTGWRESCWWSCFNHDLCRGGGVCGSCRQADLNEGNSAGVTGLCMTAAMHYIQSYRIWMGNSGKFDSQFVRLHNYARSLPTFLRLPPFVLVV